VIELCARAAVQPFRGKARDNGEELGLRLYIALKLKAHEGSIEVTSANGTTSLTLRMSTGRPGVSA
jgi:nitrogen-specific signal transduction histidine kinase